MNRTGRLLGALLTGVLVTANLIVVNLWLAKADVRHDLTADKRFEISSGTKRILERLEDTVTIKCYFSGDLPSDLAHVYDVMLEKLDEYEQLSNGKVVYEFVDPNEDEEAKQECADLGIAPVPVGTVEGGRVNDSPDKVVNVYLASVFRYGDRKVTISFFKDLASLDAGKLASDLEYFITKSIRNVSTERKTLGFLADVEMVPSNPRDPRSQKVPRQGLNNLRAVIEKTHDVVIVNPEELNRGQLVPAVVDVLLVHKATKLDDTGLYALDQFLINGGNAMFFVDRGTVDFNVKPKQERLGNTMVQNFDLATYAATAVESKVVDLLTHHGITVESAFVLDESCAQTRYVKEKGQAKRDILGRGFVEPITDDQPYRPWPMLPDRGDDGIPVDEAQISDQYSLVSPNQDFVFTWASPITVHDDVLAKMSGEVTTLFRSGPVSWRMPIKESSFPPHPDKRGEQGDIERSKLAVLVRGRFRSFFKGSEIPTPAGAPGQAVPAVEELAKSRLDEAREPGTIVVVGDQDFIGDGMIGVIVQNEAAEKSIRNWQRDPRAQTRARASLYFAANVIDVLGFGEEASDVFNLRRRVLASREIRKLEDDDPQITDIKWVNFFFLPALVIVFGIGRMIVRRMSMAQAA